MERRVTESITMDLSRNASRNIYKNNAFSTFRTALPAGVILDGSWEVVLHEIVYPSSFNNDVGKKVLFFGPLRESVHKVAKCSHVGTEQRPIKLWQRNRQPSGSLNQKKERNNTNTSSNLNCSDL